MTSPHLTARLTTAHLTGPPSRPSRTTRRLGALVGVSLILALAGCSDASKGEGKTELVTGDFRTSVQQWREKMDDCMLAAGFDMRTTTAPDGTSGSVDTSTFDMAAFDPAYAACTQEVGEAPVDPDQPTEEELFESQLAFAGCMRDRGYDVPDPERNGGLSQAFGPETDADDVDACSKLAYGTDGKDGKE